MLFCTFISLALVIPVLTIYLILKTSLRRDRRVNKTFDDKVEVPLARVRTQLGFNYPVDRFIPKDMMDTLRRLDQ